MRQNTRQPATRSTGSKLAANCSAEVFFQTVLVYQVPSVLFSHRFIAGCNAAKFSRISYSRIRIRQESASKSRCAPVVNPYFRLQVDTVVDQFCRLTFVVNSCVSEGSNGSHSTIKSESIESVRVDSFIWLTVIICEMRKCTRAGDSRGSKPAEGMTLSRRSAYR